AGATPAAGTGFTSVGTFWSNPPDVARMEHRRLEATDATASTFTAGVNDSHLAAQMIFVESAEGVSGDGALAASASTVAGTGERVVTGSGAAQAQAATAVATGYRDV